MFPMWVDIWYNVLYNPLCHFGEQLLEKFKFDHWPFGLQITFEVQNLILIIGFYVEKHLTKLKTIDTLCTELWYQKVKNNHIWPGASEDDVDDDDMSKYSTKLIKIDALYTELCHLLCHLVIHYWKISDLHFALLACKWHLTDKTCLLLGCRGHRLGMKTQIWDEKDTD